MRTITIPAKAEETYVEDIHAYTHNRAAKMITLAVGVCDSNGTFVQGQTFETLTISGQDYADLLSADGGPDKPSLGKPAGTFRKDDMWHFIDKIRARNTGV